MITLELYTYRYTLPEPVSISFHTWHYRENFLVKLTFGGYSGLGEAAPFALITGDSPEDVQRDARLVETLPFDPTHDTLEQLHAFLETKIASHTLRAAIDFAYHDLIGKIRHVPVYALYSSAAPRLVDNSVTVFIKNNLEETQDEVRRMCRLYPELKIMKLKLKGDGDIERAQAVKRAAMPNLRYVVDANQGFSDPREAVAMLTDISRVLGDVVLVEEPCPKGDFEKMRYVSEHLNFPVFADESAATLSDVQKLVAERSASGVNVKLQKAGGIWPSKLIVELCQRAGMNIMVGCMSDGPIAISAGVHFAVSTPSVVLTDLDMDLDMPAHISGGAAFRHGMRVPNEKDGLGVEIDTVAFERLMLAGVLKFERIF